MSLGTEPRTLTLTLSRFAVEGTRLCRLLGMGIGDSPLSLAALFSCRGRFLPSSAAGDGVAPDAAGARAIQRVLQLLLIVQVVEGAPDLRERLGEALLALAVSRLGLSEIAVIGDRLLVERRQLLGDALHEALLARQVLRLPHPLRRCRDLLVERVEEIAGDPIDMLGALLQVAGRVLEPHLGEAGRRLRLHVHDEVLQRIPTAG